MLIYILGVHSDIYSDNIQLFRFDTPVVYHWHWSMVVVRGNPLAFTFVMASGELPDSSDAIQWLKESC